MTMSKMSRDSSSIVSRGKVSIELYVAQGLSKKKNCRCGTKGSVLHRLTPPHIGFFTHTTVAG